MITNKSSQNRVPPEWLSKQVEKRRSVLIDLKDESSKDSMSLKLQAWNEIHTLAMKSFGGDISMSELLQYYGEKTASECSRMTGGSKTDTSGIDIESLINFNGTSEDSNSEVNIKDELPDNTDYDEDMDINPENNIPLEMNELSCYRKYPSFQLPNRTYYSAHPKAYSIIVREVLNRAHLLVHKYNSKSRTPHANHARWLAWETVRKIVQEECGKEISIEQIQVIWRHQKHKLSSEVLDEAVKKSLPHSVSPNTEREASPIQNTLEPILSLLLDASTSNPITPSEPAVPMTTSSVGRPRRQVTVNKLPPPSPTVPPPPQTPPFTEDMLRQLLTAHTEFLKKTAEIQSQQMQVLEKFSSAIETILKSDTLLKRYT